MKLQEYRYIAQAKEIDDKEEKLRLFQSPDKQQLITFDTLLRMKNSMILERIDEDDHSFDSKKSTM